MTIKYYEKATATQMIKLCKYTVYTRVYVCEMSPAAIAHFWGTMANFLASHDDTFIL